MVNKPSYNELYGSQALNDSVDYTVIPTDLATAVGLEESAFLQKVNGWCKFNQRNKKEDHFIDGHWWTYNTYGDWLKDMPYLKNETKVKRLALNLEEAGLLISMVRRSLDRTKWYRVDVAAIGAMLLDINGGDNSPEPDKTRKTNNETVNDNHRATAIDKDAPMHQIKMTSCIGSNCSDDLYTINKLTKPNPQEREKEEKPFLSRDTAILAEVNPYEDEALQGYEPISNSLDWRFKQAEKKVYPWRYSWKLRDYDKAFCQWLVSNAPGVAARCSDVDRKHGMADAMAWLTNKERQVDGLLELLDLWAMYEAPVEEEAPSEAPQTAKGVKQILSEHGAEILWDAEKQDWSKFAKESAMDRLNAEKRYDAERIVNRDDMLVTGYLANKLQFKDYENLRLLAQYAQKNERRMAKMFLIERFKAFVKKTKEITTYRVNAVQDTAEPDNDKPILFTYWNTLKPGERVTNVLFEEHPAKVLLTNWFNETKHIINSQASNAA